jgi:hypothetical protein
MKPSPLSSSLVLRNKAVLVAFACAFGVALASVSPLQAANPPAMQSLADKAQKLPVSATFEKVKNNEGPPFVMKLKNESEAPLEVSVTILLSVLSHNRDKARHVPPQVIQPGKTWTVDGLAALDKVTVAAKGFAPLQLEVK